MQYNGFTIDNTGRIVFNDTDSITSTFVGIPATATGEAAVSQSAATSGNNRVGFAADGRVAYIDMDTDTYTGPKYNNGSIMFTVDGRVMCSSQGAPAAYVGGLPFTAEGYLCIDALTPLPSFTIATETGDLLVTETGDILVTK